MGHRLLRVFGLWACGLLRVFGLWACGLLSSAPPVLSHPPSLGTLQVGEDVPDARKCACASHVAKVAEFFQVRWDWV